MEHISNRKSNKAYQNAFDKYGLYLIFVFINALFMIVKQSVVEP